MITLLDYGAGNVRSVVNAIESLGETVQPVQNPQDILSAERLVFPGVGAFGSMMEILHARGYVAPLKAYLQSGRPFLGICLGMQALFEESEEAPGMPGLGLMKGRVKRFQIDRAVPHIGWNGIKARQASPLFNGLTGDEKFYFVHSYHVAPEDPDVVLTATDYGYEFVSAVQQGNIMGTQFHPEKSGAVWTPYPGKLSGRRNAGRIAGACSGNNPTGQADYRLPGCARQRPGRPGGHQGRPVRCPRSRPGPQPGPAGRPGRALLPGGRRRDYLSQHHRLPGFSPGRHAHAGGAQADLT